MTARDITRTSAPVGGQQAPRMGDAVQCPVATKRPDEIEVGDIILFFGEPHRVATIEPYVHPIVTNGETWRIARAADGWGMTLPLNGLTQIEVG